MNKMPDESCRKCGNPLYFFSKCDNCKMVFQEICMICGEKTLPRYHICSSKHIRLAIYK